MAGSSSNDQSACAADLELLAHAACALADGAPFAPTPAFWVALLRRLVCVALDHAVVNDLEVAVNDLAFVLGVEIPEGIRIPTAGDR